ncbi:nucleotide-diphospho-sugar transferase [Aspergillus affinis]|uniref:nucleotide-diphospho-sugar transferase n=1 Tax=Aspergillus affinis TaxID=1070780 RepID=UPI0022FE3BBA|nr:nucleotide-diphospho-sugar transferase [Aspergillus affinis]KAI9036774.1 nucleotide-diphospho-sugar transferase [Aspergillus affinis]
MINHHPQWGPPVGWSRFAYAEYVTNTLYLCNSVMLFEALHRLGSKPDRLMMYPSAFLQDEKDDSTEPTASQGTGRIWSQADADRGAKSRQGSSATWADSYTKLLAFNQTQYDRVLSLDSDSTILQTMDELFFSPPSPVAMPRAYWLNFSDRILSSQLILVRPTNFEFNRILKAISEAGNTDYDTEIVNNLYRDSALILPHRPYDILTGEFRSKRHTDYLGNPLESWDPVAAFQEAKFLHFSDWPFPKSWIAASPATVEEKQPTCDLNINISSDGLSSHDLTNFSFLENETTLRQKLLGSKK